MNNISIIEQISQKHSFKQLVIQKTCIDVTQIQYYTIYSDLLVLYYSDTYECNVKITEIYNRLNIR